MLEIIYFVNYKPYNHILLYIITIRIRKTISNLLLYFHCQIIYINNKNIHTKNKYNTYFHKIYILTFYYLHDINYIIINNIIISS